MEFPISQNQIFCIYNTDVSWKLWRFEHERLWKSCPFTHQFGAQLMLRTLTRCTPFRICSLQSFVITTIVMDSQERRNVWQSLQTNWSFSEHTFPLCMLLGKHVTSSLIGILLYEFSARYKKNPEILSHENEANNSCKCKMHRREWMVTVSWILYTIENFLQFF
jgi:hypothetical protein